MRVFFCPSPGRYAAIRMDPVAMVEHLNDPEALAAAQAIKPKPYLVYIEVDLALPFPDKPWYSFTVSPIGPFPRPPDPKQHVTSDMCIPILPNESHPTDRPPLRTEPQFPYSNCYHWVLTEMDVRVAAEPEGFDDDAAVKLPSVEQIKMSCHWSADFDCIRIARGDPVAPTVTESELPAQEIADPGSADPNCEPAVAVDADPASNRVGVDDGVASVFSDITSRSSISSAVDSVDAIMDMAIFGGQDGNQEILPLVHLSYDLTAHLQQEEIPSPVDLYKEHEAIVNIIQEARARNPDLPRLDTSMYGLSEDDSDIGSMSDMSDELARPRRKYFHPLKLLHKAKSRLQQFFRPSPLSS